MQWNPRSIMSPDVNFALRVALEKWATHVLMEYSLVHEFQVYRDWTLADAPSYVIMGEEGNVEFPNQGQRKAIVSCELEVVRDSPSCRLTLTLENMDRILVLDPDGYLYQHDYQEDFLDIGFLKVVSDLMIELTDKARDTQDTLLNDPNFALLGKAMDHLERPR